MKETTAVIQTNMKLLRAALLIGGRTIQSAIYETKRVSSWSSLFDRHLILKIPASRNNLTIRPSVPTTGLAWLSSLSLCWAPIDWPSPRCLSAGCFGLPLFISRLLACCSKALELQIIPQWVKSPSTTNKTRPCPSRLPRRHKLITNYAIWT